MVELEKDFVTRNRSPDEAAAAVQVQEKQTKVNSSIPKNGDLHIGSPISRSGTPTGSSMLKLLTARVHATQNEFMTPVAPPRLRVTQQKIMGVSTPEYNNSSKAGTNNEVLSFKTPSTVRFADNEAETKNDTDQENADLTEISAKAHKLKVAVGLENESIPDHIVVAVRIRPVIPSESNKGCDTMAWTNTKNRIQSLSTDWNKLNAEEIDCLHLSTDISRIISYDFDKVFGKEDDNHTVYLNMGQRMVKHVCEGYNSTLLTYGQTSSGKTHTILGRESDSGILNLCVRDLFMYIEDCKTSHTFTVEVSYCEIYQEVLVDLLDRTKKNMAIMEDPLWGPSVKGLSYVQVDSAEKLLQLLEIGEKSKHMGRTEMNKNSSRSHTIFQIRLQTSLKIDVLSMDRTQEPDSVEENDVSDLEKRATEAMLERAQQGPVVAVSTMNIIDLAGSERVSKTKARGQRLAEAGQINKSLAALGNVIAAINAKSPHIPFRRSKLTRLLANALGGNSCTGMIFCISPVLIHRDESKSTLDFAKRASRVKTHAICNKVETGDELVQQFMSEISELRNKLAIKETNETELQNCIENLQTKLSRRALDMFKTPRIRNTAYRQRITRTITAPKTEMVHRSKRFSEESSSSPPNILVESLLSPSPFPSTGLFTPNSKISINSPVSPVALIQDRDERLIQIKTHLDRVNKSLKKHKLKSTEEIEEFKDQLKRCKMEKDALQSKLNEFNIEKRILQDQNDVMAKKIEGLTEKIDEDFVDLDWENANLKMRIDTLEERCEQKTESYNKVKAELENCLNEIQNGKQKIRQQNVYVENLESQLKDTKEDLRQLEISHGKYKDEAHNSMRQFEKEKEELQLNRQMMVDNGSKCEKEMIKLKNENGKLEQSKMEQKIEFENENALLKRQILDLKTELNSIQAQHEEKLGIVKEEHVQREKQYKSRIDDSQLKALEYVNDIKLLSEQNRMFQAELDSTKFIYDVKLEKALSELKNKANADPMLEEKNIGLLKKINLLKMRHEDDIAEKGNLEEKINVLSNEHLKYVETLTTKFKKFQIEEEVIRKENEQLETENLRIVEQLGALEKLNSDLENRLIRFQVEIDSFVTENNSWNEKNLSIGQELDEMKTSTKGFEALKLLVSRYRAEIEILQKDNSKLVNMESLVSQQKLESEMLKKEHRTLKETNQSITEELKRLEKNNSETEDLKAKLAESKLEIEILERENNALKDKTQSLGEELKHLRTETEEVQHLKTKISKYELETEMAVADNVELKNRNLDINDELGRVRQRIEYKDQKINEINILLNNTKADLQKQQREHEVLRGKMQDELVNKAEQLRSAQQEISDKSAKIANIQQMLNEANSTLRQHEVKTSEMMSELNSHNEKLRLECEQVNVELRNTKLDLDNQQERLKSLEDDNMRLGKENYDINSKLLKLNSLNEQLRKGLTEAEARFQETKNKSISLIELNDKLTLEKEDIIKQNEESNKDFYQLQEIKEKTSLELAQAQISLVESADKMKMIQSRLDESNKALEKNSELLEQEKKTKQYMAEELEIIKSQLGKSIKKLEKNDVEHSETRRLNHDLQVKLAKSQQELEGKKSSASRLKAALEESEKAYDSLKSDLGLELSDQVKKNVRLQQLLTERTEEIQSAQSQLSKIDNIRASELDSLKRKYAKHEFEMREKEEFWQKKNSEGRRALELAHVEIGKKSEQIEKLEKEVSNQNQMSMSSLSLTLSELKRASERVSRLLADRLPWFLSVTETQHPSYFEETPTSCVENTIKLLYNVQNTVKWYRILLAIPNKQIGRLKSSDSDKNIQLIADLRTECSSLKEQNSDLVKKVEISNAKSEENECTIQKLRRYIDNVQLKFNESEKVSKKNISIGSTSRRKLFAGEKESDDENSTLNISRKKRENQPKLDNPKGNNQDDLRRIVLTKSIPRHHSVKYKVQDNIIREEIESDKENTSPVSSIDRKTLSNRNLELLDTPMSTLSTNTSATPLTDRSNVSLHSRELLRYGSAGRKLEEMLEGNQRLSQAFIEKDQQVKESTQAIEALIGIVGEADSDVKSLIHVFQTQKDAKQLHLETLQKVRSQMENLLQRNRERKLQRSIRKSSRKKGKRANKQ